MPAKPLTAKEREILTRIADGEPVHYEKGTARQWARLRSERLVRVEWSEDGSTFRNIATKNGLAALGR